MLAVRPTTTPALSVTGRPSPRVAADARDHPPSFDVPIPPAVAGALTSSAWRSGAASREAPRPAGRVTRIRSVRDIVDRGRPRGRARVVPRAARLPPHRASAHRRGDGERRGGHGHPRPRRGEGHGGREAGSWSGRTASTHSWRGSPGRALQRGAGGARVLLRVLERAAGWARSRPTSVRRTAADGRRCDARRPHVRVQGWPRAQFRDDRKTSRARI